MINMFHSHLFSFNFYRSSWLGIAIFRFNTVLISSFNLSFPNGTDNCTAHLVKMSASGRKTTNNQAITGLQLDKGLQTTQSSLLVKYNIELKSIKSRHSHPSEN